MPKLLKYLLRRPGYQKMTQAEEASHLSLVR